MSRALEIVEVGPRDGLQSESTVLDPKTRLELIVLLIEAGVRRIEVASFVNPERVPQMAGAEEVVSGLPDDDSVSYIGLVLNHRGLQRALETKLDEINFVVAASDGYNRSNQRASVDETLAELVTMIPEAQAARRRASVTISVAFGDPFDGEVPVQRLARVAQRVAEAGVDELALGDTIGVASPADVAERIEAVHAVAGGAPIRCHFHNTRNTGYANAVAAIDAGARSLDASVGGYGGSPFTTDAGGNIATEDLSYMLGRMGIEHHLAVDRLVTTAAWLEEKLGSPAKAMLGRAGGFPS
ncbi:MAG: hydroxymethylglutaryl-CoA lyase [Acidimicrobiia bacterium]|nr:hydroxymethylglutaryl-CoA lyase [Acidimicrobiia bacterium]